jgi:hypothetical protein
MTKMAVFLGAGPFQFGLLSAIGQVSQVFQPLGLAVTRSLTRRKKAVIILAASGRAVTPLFGLLPFVLASPQALTGFLAAFFAVTALLAVSTNAWMGWIGDMVPTRIRGRFIARRNQLLMLAGLAGGYVFGIGIDLFDRTPGAAAGLISRLAGLPPLDGMAGWAFLALFTIAGALGLFGLSILRRQPEREKEVESASFASLLAVPLRDRNFRRLLLFGGWWMLAIGVGAPFWQPFMINELGMSVFSIQIYGTISTLSAMASLQAWGRFVDRWGNRNAMAVAILMGSANPMFWVAADASTVWLVYIEAALSGCMWAGAGIIAMNFVLSIAPDQSRQAYSGLYGAACGLGMVVTMLLSGLLMPPPVIVGDYWIHPMQVLFFLTGILRLTALIPLFWVAEPEARPFTAVIRRVLQFAAVRVTALAAVLHRSGGDQDGPCAPGGEVDNPPHGGDL